MLLLDWDATNGNAIVDHVTLVECTGAGACPATSDVPSAAPPALSTIGARSTPSDTPLTIGWTSGTPTSVTSSNPDLIPDRNIAYATVGGATALTATPVPDRSGEATLTVTHAGGTEDIAVTVSDARLLDRGFEQGGAGWTSPLPAGATVDTMERRSGTSSLRLADGAGEVAQTVLHLDYGRTYVFGGWVKGAVEFEVRTPEGDLVPGTAVTPVAGASYTRGAVTFTTGPEMTPNDPPTRPETRAEVVVVVKDGAPTSTASFVDDLFLYQGPVIGPQLREWSAFQNDLPPTDWQMQVDFAVGRVPANGIWDPAVVAVTSSDPSKPTVDLAASHPIRPGWWRLVLATPTGGGTGEVTVTVSLTDPHTGAQVTREFPVNVNAGNNFNNGNFERGFIEPWQDVFANLDLRPLRPESAPPVDEDRVMRINQGFVRHVITGLDEGTTYTVTASAFGEGARIAAYEPGDPAHPDYPFWPGPMYNSDTATSPGTWGQATFTFATSADPDPGDEAEVWLQIEDTSAASPAAAGDSCLVARQGESCWDDITIFEQ